MSHLSYFAVTCLSNRDAGSSGMGSWELIIRQLDNCFVGDLDHKKGEQGARWIERRQAENKQG